MYKRVVNEFELYQTSKLQEIKPTLQSKKEQRVLDRVMNFDPPKRTLEIDSNEFELEPNKEFFTISDKIDVSLPGMDGGTAASGGGGTRPRTREINNKTSMIKVSPDDKKEPPSSPSLPHRKRKFMFKRSSGQHGLSQTRVHRTTYTQTRKDNQTADLFSTYLFGGPKLSLNKINATSSNPNPNPPFNAAAVTTPHNNPFSPISASIPEAINN